MVYCSVKDESMSKELIDQLIAFMVDVIVTIFLAAIIYYVYKLTDMFSYILGGWQYLIYLGDIIFGILIGIGRFACLFYYFKWIINEILNLALWTWRCIVHLKILPFVSWIAKDTYKKRKEEVERQKKTAEKKRREKMKQNFLSKLQSEDQKQYSKGYDSIYDIAIEEGQEYGRKIGYDDGYAGRDKQYLEE